MGKFTWGLSIAATVFFEIADARPVLPQSTEFRASEFFGTALGIHAWGRELQGRPTNCVVTVTGGGNFENRSVGVHMDVDPVSQGDAGRRGYGFYYGFGGEGTTPAASSSSGQDPYNWSRTRREQSTVTSESGRAAYGVDKMIYTDLFSVTLQTPEDFSKMESLHVKLWRTYTQDMIEFDRMMREAGASGDELFDPAKIGTPVELMDVSCSSFQEGTR